jgi:hypothetical protein
MFKKAILLMVCGWIDFCFLGFVHTSQDNKRDKTVQEYMRRQRPAAKPTLKEHHTP